MGDLKHFAPRSELAASANLSEFIRLCRDELTVFGAEIHWDDTAWPKAMHFTKLGSNGRGYKESDRMSIGFIDFAKAYFRYQQGHQPTKTKNESKALRVIEAALLQVNNLPDITQINTSVLDESAVLARDHYSKGAAYHCGREIERIAKFLTNKKLISTSLSTWKSPIKKPEDNTIRTGAKAKARQEKKLPSQEALDALAEIFATNPSNPKDIFTTSTFAMTMCAPSRISEILELPVDCEVELIDAEGIIEQKWRFYAAKGYEGYLKDIPEVMETVAKEAVKRIRKITDGPRKLASWIETNRDQPYRHENCPNVEDDKPLTAFQACEYLGLESSTRKACAGSLGGMMLDPRDGAHTLNSLWRWALSHQPRNFPWLNKEKKIKYSNALFCMTRNQIGDHRGTSPLILWAPTNNVFNYTLSPRETVKNHKSIFDRYGYKSAEGERLKVTSHQARHLLSTLANRGGLSQELQARYAGRAKESDNAVYNNMSEFEMVAKAEAMDTTLTLFGPKGEVRQHVPISSNDVDLMERGAMHVSVWGVCSHDFVMAPCEKFRDCLNCEEHVCIKGDSERSTENLNRIKDRLAQVEIDFKAATQALANGYSGADRWYEYHQKTLERLRQLVEILESPQIENGAQIKLRDGKEFSHLRRVIRLKAVESIEMKKPYSKILSEMTKMLRAS